MTDDDAAHQLEHFRSQNSLGVGGGHSIDVDKGTVLALGTALSRDASALDDSAGSIPNADAGVMTRVIEGEIAKLLGVVTLLADATSTTGEKIQVAAQNYQKSDEGAEQRFTQLQVVADRQGSRGSQRPRTLTDLLAETTGRGE